MSAKRPCQALPGPLSPAVKRPARESDHPPQSVVQLGMRVAPAQPSTAQRTEPTTHHLRRETHTVITDSLPTPPRSTPSADPPKTHLPPTSSAIPLYVYYILYCTLHRYFPTHLYSLFYTVLYVTLLL